MGNNVGHQHIAKFLLSMLFNFEFSETLKLKAKETNCEYFKMKIKGK